MFGSILSDISRIRNTFYTLAPNFRSVQDNQNTFSQLLVMVPSNTNSFGFNLGRFEMATSQIKNKIFFCDLGSVTHQIGLQRTTFLIID